MFLRNYEQRLAPQLASELGEPILRCIALNTPGVHDRMVQDGLPFWRRQSLIVNGQPRTKLPQTMFLILTPTRVLITDIKAGYRPDLNRPILTLLRGDAEMTAVQDGGLWLYHLKSRGESAELDLELASGRGIAAELAAQLREFSVTQPAHPTSGLTAPPEPTVASQMLDNRRRRQTKSYRMGAVLAVVLSLLFFGSGAYQVYGYHVGTPTKATLVSCSRSAGRSAGQYVVDTLTGCRGEWTLDGRTHTGRIWGKVGRVQEGSSLDVRVLNGWAFAPGFPKWIFMLGAVFAVLAFLLFMPERGPRRLAGPAQRGRHAAP